MKPPICQSLSRIPIRMVLLAVLAVLGGWGLVASLQQTGKSMQNFKQSRTTYERARSAAHLLAAAKPLAYERGRATVMLRGARPASDADRAFVGARRREADAALDEALGDKPNMPPALYADLAARRRDLGKMRRLVDRNVTLALGLRDKRLADRWFVTASEFIGSIQGSVESLAGDVRPGDKAIRPMLLAAAMLQQRLTAGGEASLIAQALAEGRPPAQETLDAIHELRGREAQLWHEIERLKQSSDIEEIRFPVEEIRKRHLAVFRPLQDRALAELGSRGRDIVPVEAFTSASLPVLDGMSDLMVRSAQQAARSGAEGVAEARAVLLARLGWSSALLVLFMLSIRYVARQVVAPLEQVDRELRRLGALPSGTGTGNEIERLRSSAAALERSIAARSESERRMAGFVASVPGFVFSFRASAEGHFSFPFASPGIIDLYGVRPEDVKDDMAPLHAITHPDDRARIESAIAASAETGAPLLVEFRVLRPGHTERWIECRSTPHREADGGTLWHGIMFDASERKQAEILLAQREREYRSLGENLPDNVVRWDVEGRYLYVNPTHARTLIRPAAELIGTYIPDSHQAVKDAITQVAATGQSISFVRQPVPDENGEIRFHEVSLVPERDGEGNIVSVLGLGRDMTEQYRMQEAIAEREKELRALADSSPGMMGSFHLRPDETICMPYVSPNIWELFGLRPQDVADDAAPLMALNHPDDARRVAESIAESARAMTPWREEYRIVHPTRGERWMEGHTTPVPHPDGGIVWYGYVHDITERKRMEGELRRQADFQQSLLDAMKDVGMQLMMVENGRIIHVGNRELARQFGYGDAELDAHPALLDIVHPDDRERVMDNYLRRLNGEAASSFYELGLVTRDGERREYETSIAVVAGTDPVRIITVGKDITERKRMEAQLKKREEDFRTLAENSLDPIYRYDRNCRRIYVNQAVGRILGRPVEELVGRTPADGQVIVSDEACKLMGAIQRVFDSGETGSVDVDFVDRDGTHRDFHMLLIPERDAAGRVATVLAMGRDITAIREVERRLSSFVANFPGFAYSFRLSPEGHGSFPFASPGIEKLYGLNPADVRDDMAPVHDLAHPDDRPRIEAAIAESARNMTPFNLESRVCRPGLPERWIEVRSVPLRDADGGILWHGLMIDIDERKRAQLRSELLDVAVDLTSDTVLLIDEQLRFAYANASACRNLGYTREELLTLGPLDIDHDTDSATVSGIMRNAPVGQSFAFETRHRAKDGRTYSVEVSGTHFMHGGRKFGMSVSRDITKRKHYEQELLERAELEQRWSHFVASAPGFFFTLLRRPDGHISMPFASNGIAELYGLEPAAVAESVEPILARDHPDDVERIFREIEHSAQTMNPCRVEFRVRNPEKGELWVEARSVPHRDQNGNIGWHGFMHDITERKHYELALLARAELERRQSQFFTVVPGFFYTLVQRPDGGYAMTFASPGIRELFGLNPEDVAQDIAPLAALAHPDDMEMTFRETEASARELAPFRIEYRIVHPHKGVRWMEANSLPQRRSDGGVRWDGFMHDITERKEADLALRESEEKLRSLYELSPLGIALTDMNGRYLEFNEAFRAICGYPAEELKTLDYWKLTPRKYELREAEQLESLSLNGHYGPYEKEYRQKDGTRIPIQLSGTLITGKDGQRRIWSMVEDISARKQAEAQLRAREEEFRALVENSPDPIIRYAPDGRRLYVNPAVLRLSGKPAEALLAYTPQDAKLVSSSDATRLLGSIRRVVETRQPVEMEVEHVAADGRRLVFHNRYVPEFGKNGKVVSVLSVSREVSERKRMEEELKASEAKHRTVFESANDGIFLHKIVERDGHAEFLLHDLNHRGCELWGHSREDILAGNFDLLEMCEAPFTREEARRRNMLAAAGEAQLFDWQLKRGDGSTLWGEVSLRRTQIGSESFLLAVIRDVTGRKAMEDLLCQREEEFHSLAENLPDPIIRYDGEGRLRYLNRAAVEMIRAEALDLLGKRAEDCSPASPGMVKIYQEKLHEVMKSGAALEFEFALSELPGGDMEHYHVRFVPELGADGRIEGVLGIGRNISERKRAEERLRQALEFSENIINAIPDLLFELDRDGRYLNIWAQSLENLVAQKEALLGRTIPEALNPEAAEIAMSAIREADERGGSFGKVMRIELPQGLAWFELSVSKKPGSDAVGGRFLMLSRDVTERRGAEAARETALAEAIRLVEMRSAFLSQMSHELRTPLNGILGFAQLLQMDGSLNEEQNDGLNIIRESGEHLLALVNDLLDFAKIEEEKLELSLGDIQLDAFLSTIAGIIGVKAEQKKLAFACEASADLPSVVRGDELRLRQVLLNLLANAVKFTDRGQVSLRVDSPSAARMRFEVRDSGIGIDDTKLETIFKPFEQVGSSSRFAEGSGLGLAISRKLVRLMGGDIAVESRLGEGSVFSFEMDLEVVHAEPMAAEIFAAQALQAPPAEPEALPFAPPAHEMQILHGLALRGNMRTIVQHAGYLAELDERHLPFAEKLMEMAKAYQSKAIVDFVERYME